MKAANRNRMLARLNMAPDYAAVNRQQSPEAKERRGARISMRPPKGDEDAQWYATHERAAIANLISQNSEYNARVAHCRRVLSDLVHVPPRGKLSEYPVALRCHGIACIHDAAASVLIERRRR